MSGERGGQGVGPSLPIQRSDNVALRKARVSSGQVRHLVETKRQVVWFKHVPCLNMVEMQYRLLKFKTKMDTP